jgi:putative membrane protein
MMGDGFGMGFGGGFMWLFWILMILVIVWAVKAVAGSGNSPTILQERYARGEIDQEEYAQKRKDLGG